jgi:pentatricopeptide repeat protein
VSTWGVLLSACQDYGNVEVGRMVARKAIELDPANVRIYTELSNLYVRNGLWEKIDQLWELMKEKELEKDVGFTWVEHY